MNSDITEQYLNRCYDDFSKEQVRILTEIKSAPEKEQDCVKQITYLNSLMLGCLRLRNLKQKIAQKGNM